MSARNYGRFLQLLLVALTAVAALVGCGSNGPASGHEAGPVTGSETESASGHETTTASGLAIARYVTDTPGLGDAALLEGTVVDYHGCLAVQQANADFLPVVPLLPIPGNDPTTLKVGDAISAGGGFTDPSVLKRDTGDRVPEACATAEQFMIVARWDLDN